LSKRANWFAMRHQKKTIKLGRTSEHRKALLANQVCSLIEHQRIRTTLAKAKAARPLAEKMVTLGKKGSLHARRTAFAVLRQKDAVKKLFDEIATRTADRHGGHSRMLTLDCIIGDNRFVRLDGNTGEVIVIWMWTNTLPPAVPFSGRTFPVRGMIFPTKNFGMTF